MATRRAFVLDANVLIDYLKSDRTVLDLAARHLGDMLVPRALLREVGGLDAQLSERLGLQLVDGTLEQLIEAGSLRGAGGLSFEDQLCLIVARDSGSTCVTNDGALRTACGRSGVPIRWGLELMVELVSLGELPADSAVEIAETISAQNPRYITPKVVEAFIRKVRLRGK